MYRGREPIRNNPGLRMYRTKLINKKWRGDSFRHPNAR
jgi:hypothetical protein